MTLASTAFTGAAVFIGRTAAWEASHVILTLGGIPITTAFLYDGFTFSLCLVGFLTVHEFGHYFAARRHGVKTSLPFFIPAPFIGIGTLGAVIRIREQIPSSRKLFDIGAAGPLAGFVVVLILLLYAMATVPPPDFMYGVSGHDDLLRFIAQTGQFPNDALPAVEGTRLTVGTTALYWGLSQLFSDLPPMYEMYHYPMLFAAWLGLFFTALNLMPVGQLDGGHIIYSLLGRAWHSRLARGFILLLLCSMAIGAVEEGPDMVAGILPQLASSPALVTIVVWFLLGALIGLFMHRVHRGDKRRALLSTTGVLIIAALAQVAGWPLTQFGYFGWVLWCFLLIFFVKLDHPPILYTEPLTRGRRLLGIANMVIFVLCFSIKPLYFG